MRGRIHSAEVPERWCDVPGDAVIRSEDSASSKLHSTGVIRGAGESQLGREAKTGTSSLQFWGPYAAWTPMFLNKINKVLGNLKNQIKCEKLKTAVIHNLDWTNTEITAKGWQHVVFTVAKEKNLQLRLVFC